MQQTLFNNRYQIEYKLGEGGMAMVYLGRDIRLNRRVAVKVLHSHYANDPEFISRFQHEAQAAAGLSHPNVVNVYDVGQDDDTHYIVMEYVDGINLKTLINREGPLPVEQALAIAEAVAHGLEAAHRYGLVHRDIKSQNILVSPDGHVRITDFGIAKSHLSTTATQTGVTFGTADYISPEQAQGHVATPRSDIYSLGVTLYEMLAGRLPFVGDSPLSVAMQHVNAEPPPLRWSNIHIPPQLEAFTLRVLAKDPHERPASAYEFAQVVHSYRTQADQHTAYAHYAPQAPQSAPTTRTGTTGGNGNTGTGRTPVLPPHSSVGRAPRRQSHGCGVALVSTMLLAGVLAVVIFLSMGLLDGGSQAGPVVAAPTITPQQTTTPTPLETQPPLVRTPINSPTPEVTETLTPSPSPSPSPSPTPVPTPTPTIVPQVVVPDIVGLTEGQAQEFLQRVGLIPVFGGSRHDDAFAAGLVLEQVFPPGLPVAVGEPVTYTVSLGPQLVTVSDLVNTPRDVALQQAESIGLNVEVVEEPSQNVAQGVVISQDPPPGAQVPPGTLMRLNVSIGDVVRFPDIIGMDRYAAQEILRRTDGLSVEYVHEQGRDVLGATFDQYAPNQVVSAQAGGQPVQNGQYVPRGSGVVLGVRASTP